MPMAQTILSYYFQVISLKATLSPDHGIFYVRRVQRDPKKESSRRPRWSLPPMRFGHLCRLFHCLLRRYVPKGSCSIHSTRGRLIHSIPFHSHDEELFDLDFGSLLPWEYQIVLIKLWWMNTWRVPDILCLILALLSFCPASPHLRLYRWLPGPHILHHDRSWQFGSQSIWPCQQEKGVAPRGVDGIVARQCRNGTTRHPASFTANGNAGQYSPQGKTIP